MDSSSVIIEIFSFSVIRKRVNEFSFAVQVKFVSINSYADTTDSKYVK